MRTSSAKAKGRRLSQQVKDLLHLYCPDIPEQDISVTPSGVNGPDLTLSAKAEEKYPYSIECKNQQALSIWACLKQAQDNAKPNTTPLLVFSRNHCETYVTLKLDDFLKLTT